MAPPADYIFCLFITATMVCHSGRDATVYPAHFQPSPPLAPSALLQPNTAAPILRNSAQVSVPVFPVPVIPVVAPFNMPKRLIQNNTVRVLTGTRLRDNIQFNPILYSIK